MQHRRNGSSSCAHRTHWPRIGGSAFAAIACAWTPPANAETLVVAPVADATLYELDGQQIANGAGQYLFAGRTFQGLQGLRRRSILRFDCSAIPPGAIVVDARVELHLVQLQGGPSEIRLHRAIARWTAGASDPSGNEGQGAPALVADCTWAFASFNGVSGGTMWRTPGGDFEPDATAVAITERPGAVVWKSADLIGDVQEFVTNPSANHGWFLVGDESRPGTARRFDSAQAETGAGIAPVLVIEWLPKPACPADLNGDSLIDASDLSILLAAWTTADADIDGDGTTSASDLALLLGAWGACD